jgi:hypothetical protein
MDRGIVAHSLVTAHAERVREFARLFDQLERALAARGTDQKTTEEAYRRLTARLVAWELADHEAEQCDVVTLPADERQALRQAVARATGHAEQHARGLPATAREQAVVRSLCAIDDGDAAFPTVLTRATLARFHRSAARLGRLEALRAPAFLLGNEAAVLLGALQSASAPVVRPEVDIRLDAEDGFQSTFAWGLETCAIRAPGAPGAVDLGLGTSPAFAQRLGLEGADLPALYQAWRRSAAPEHPFARQPYVPAGRFCAPGPARRVRADLDSTGPIGWAAGDDVAHLARELAGLATAQPAAAAELLAVAERLEQAAGRGEAVIGFVEYVPPEAERERKWLIDPASDAAR